MAGKRKLGIGFEVFCIMVGIAAILTGMSSCAGTISQSRFGETASFGTVIAAFAGWFLGSIMIGMAGIIGMIRRVAERDDPPKRKHQDPYGQDLDLPRP